MPLRRSIGDYLDEPDPPFALWQDLFDALFDESGKLRLDRVGRVAGTVFIVRTFGGQRINGGLHGFLENSSGAFAPQTVEALRDIGANNAAHLLEESLSLLANEGCPGHWTGRESWLYANRKRVTQLLDPLESRAEREIDPIDPCAAQHAEILDDLLLAYMRAHRQDESK